MSVEHRSRHSAIHVGEAVSAVHSMDNLRHYPEPEAPLTRAEVEEAIRNMRATMKRAPSVMSERYHQQLDALLDQWDTAVWEESLND